MAAPRASLRASPWLALVVVLVGSYAAVLNTTVIGVALPSVAADFGAAGVLDVDWVVTSYLLGVVMIQPATAWLADRWGRRRVFLSALALFGIGGLLCTVAPSMAVLVAGRFVQGLGGGAVMPVGMAIIYELFPPTRRGTALGVWGLGTAGAPAAGPPFGGWLVTVAGWRWIFVSLVLVAAVACVLGALLLRDSGFREPRRLDLSGWSLAAAGFVLVVVTSRQASGWGFGSPVTVLTVAAAVVVMIAFVRRSLAKPEPIIDFRMFRTPTFSVAIVVSALLSIAQLARHNYLPVELQVVRGLDAQNVGLLLAPSAIGIAVVMPISGWLADRIGARVPVMTGLSLVAASMWQLAHLRPDHSTGRIVAILIVQGLGSGLAFVPTTVAAMNSLPARYVAQASAIKSLDHQFAGAVGVAVIGAFVVARLGAIAPTGLPADQTQAAYNGAFQVAFWIVIAAMAAAVFLPGRRQAAAQQAARAAEQRATVEPSAVAALEVPAHAGPIGATR